MEINLISAMLMKGLFFLKKNVSQVLLRRHLTKRSVLSSETYQAYSMKLNANFPKYLSLYACQVLFLLLFKIKWSTRQRVMSTLGCSERQKGLRLKLSMVLSESSGTCNQCVRSGAGMISKLKYYLI